MKKILAFLLLAVMLVSTSCAAEPVTLLPFLNDSGSNGVNYGGVEIIINSNANAMNDDETYWAQILKYDTNTNYGDAILARVADVEEKLGVKISYDTEADGEDILPLQIMAGTYVGDIVNYTSFGAMENFASANLLFPMTNFDHIDLAETWKYGNANVLEGAMVKSVPYAVQPVQWPDWEPSGISSMIYNMDMISELSLTDPHEFWENENWYWDTFEDTYLNVTTGLSEDEWMLSASEYIFWYGLMYSNDVQFVSANADGEYVVNSMPQSIIEAVQEGVDWYQNHRDIVNLYSEYWSHKDYDNGLSVFTVTGATTAVSASIDVTSGLMPFPCGPSATYGTWRQAFDRIDGFGIPITSPEPDIAAHVISELFEPLDEYLGVSLEEYYKEMMFNTETDAEIYMELIKDVRYDYTFHGGSDLMRSVNNNFSSAIKSGKAANEAAETFSNQILAIMTAYALPNYEYMYKNFYSLENAD